MAFNEQKKLLSIHSLSLGFKKDNGFQEVVHGIDFDVFEGEILGIVGESGSGKSVTALSILKLLAASGKILNGNIQFDGNEITELSEKQLQKIRGSQISYVFQEPMTSLNSVLTIGKQLEEMLLLHEDMDKEKRQERMVEALEEVGLQQVRELLHAYPHQLSGGMRQRVMIAMAMICRPRLLIADEPTTALDITVQAKVLDLLKELNQKHGTTILLISHDLFVIRSICSRVIVMRQGDIVEQGNVDFIYESPNADYTKQLLEASLHLHSIKEDDKSLKKSEEDRKPVLSVKQLSVCYPNRKERLFAKTTKKEVVKKVSFDLYQGEIFGIVGESGCGKSTLVKAIAGLNPMVTGVIDSYKIRPQMVFQDPYSSLNPSKTIGWLLEEPLRLTKTFTKEQRKQLVLEMLQKIGLGEQYFNRLPSDLSGGQRQRVAIGMAVITNPALVILDEPVSSLDVTVQEQILDLLLQLRNEYQLSYLFISHDMGVIRKLCDRVAVMYAGEIIELDDCETVFCQPQKEYTKQLIQAAEYQKNM